MNEIILEKSHFEGYEYCRIPGIIRTKAGSLITYCECRHTVSDWAGMDICMRKSTDDGVTWSERRVLVPGGEHTVNNPIMFADDGEITLVYQWEYNKTFYKKSYDDGETFGESVEITEQLKSSEFDYTVIACGPGHGTILSSGRYITPVWLVSNPENPKSHHPSIIATAYSDDKGKTWKFGEFIKDSFLINPSETTIAEIDGKVIINIRNENPEKKRAIAYSDDGISGWHSIHFDEKLTDPTCAAGMISLGNDLYFSNCRDSGRRINLTLSKSSDFGKTWEDVCVVSDYAGYSDIASNGKDTIFVYYEHWVGDDLTLRFVPIKL